MLTAAEIVVVTNRRRIPWCQVSRFSRTWGFCEHTTVAGGQVLTSFLLRGGTMPLVPENIMSEGPNGRQDVHNSGVDTQLAAAPPMRPD